MFYFTFVGHILIARNISRIMS